MEKEMSEESRRKWDRWPAEFRQQALERMKTCQNVKVLAKELGVARQQLYLWKQQAEERKKASEAGSEDPRELRIRELEKKVGDLQGCLGEKALELDFFAGALRRIEESRQRKGKTGATASTPKSAGGCNRKVD
jgi:transposase-like protein